MTMISIKNAITKSGPKLFSTLCLLFLLGSSIALFKKEEEACKEKDIEIVWEEPTTSLTHFFNGHASSKNYAFLDSHIELSLKHRNLHAILFSAYSINAQSKVLVPMLVLLKSGMLTLAKHPHTFKKLKLGSNPFHSS